MSRFALVALVVTMSACVSDDDDEAPDTIEPVPLAEVEGDGAAIRWFAPDAPGDDLTMQVEAHFPSPPLVDSTLVDELSAVRVYLAVAPVDRPLPVGLVPYATPAEMTLSNDVVARSALRDRNLQRLAEFAPDLDVQEANPASCDAAFRNWARAAYGPVYGDTSTCTNDTGFGNHVGDTWYCNLVGEDCDYGLAETQACEADNCTAVRGDTTSMRARFAVWPNGDPAFQTSGIRARLGYANCDWNYTAVQRRQRNYGAWTYLNIPPRSLIWQVQGASDPRPGAYPTLGLLGGFWKQEIDSSSASYLQNRQEIVAPTQGYVCSDVIKHFETFDGSPLSCNNGQRLCDDSTCSGWGNCWD